MFATSSPGSWFLLESQLFSVESGVRRKVGSGEELAYPNQVKTLPRRLPKAPVHSVISQCACGKKKKQHVIVDATSALRGPVF